MTGVHQRGTRGRAAALAAAVCLLAGVRPAAGQEGAAVGAQVGYSRADLTGENANLVDSRQGAITGIYFQLPLNRLVSVRPEVLFSVKGGTTLTRIGGGTDLALLDIELAYLELPLLGRLTLPRGRFRPAVFGGPAIGIQIGCDFLFTTPTGSVDGTCGEDSSTAGVSEWDYGWIAGAAIEMHLPRTTLALQGRYSAGLRSVVEGPVDLKNRGIAVLFGLTF
ncbi:MAG TPA: porin family protein [Gemmatimonadales bacterium]|nr:porin family protein [Gemmatimonadales bacterium]